MSLLKSILKRAGSDSSKSKDSASDTGLSLEQSKARIEELRNSISGLKRRHERSIQLKAATCNTARSIQKNQTEISRLKRRFPSIASANQDNYRT